MVMVVGLFGSIYEGEVYYAVFDTEKKQVAALENHVLLSGNTYSLWSLPGI